MLKLSTALIVSLCLALGACSSEPETQPDTTVIADDGSTDSGSTTEPNEAQTTDPSTVDSTDPSKMLTIEGAGLPIASDRQEEADESVGMRAPILTFGELVIPSDRPTLLLVAVGSCADCEAAADNLKSLAPEFDAVAVVIGPADTPDITEPWLAIRDEDAARAFGGRNRPTAIVIGVDGTVLSRTRPYNRSGVNYDLDELRSGLEIARNQTLKARVGKPIVAVEDQRSGQLPDSFFAVQSDGDAVEVDTATGEELNRIPALPSFDEPEIQDQVFDEVVPIPGSTGLLVNECCEPAAGQITYLQDWADFTRADLEPGFAGWEVSVSPAGDRFVLSGYQLEIVEVGADRRTPRLILGTSDGSNPDVAWLRDRLGVVYLHRGTSPAMVELIEFDDQFRPISRHNFRLQGPASSIDVNAKGQLVVAATDYDRAAVSGQVYDPDSGELVAEFALEDGVKELDYDVTGRYLAYVDGQNIARWQGGGKSGVLGEGYFTVNW